MRLPRERRIRASADFQRLRSQGSRLDCGPFLLNIGLAAAGATPQPARFAIVVAKKAIPLAVNRNRAKRLARELFRTDPEALPLGWEVVLIARPSLLRKPLKDLRRIYAVAVAGAVAKAAPQAE
jgi:ribonuclease P protein component